MLTQIDPSNTPDAATLPPVDVASLIRAGSGEVPAPAEPAPAAEAIGGIPREQFFTALTDFSGGAVKDHDTFTQTIQAAGRARELEQRVAELDGKLKLPKFHDSIAERVNSMRSAGHSTAEIRQFLELSDLDLTKIDPLEAIRRHYSLTKTGYTPDEINLLIEQDLGFDPNDTETELTGRQKLNLKERSKEAIQALQAQQVSAENPEAVQRARQAQAVAEHTVKTWERVLPGFPAETKWSLPLDKEQTTELQFKPSPEAVELARAATMQDIANAPHNFPPVEETSQRIAQIYQNYLFLADMQSALETVSRNAYAKGVEFVMQKNSGNGAVLQRPMGVQQQINPNAGKQEFSLLG